LVARCDEPILLSACHTLMDQRFPAFFRAIRPQLIGPDQPVNRG
jgi:hypothetical protein